jgi:hypothetical protein
MIKQEESDSNYPFVIFVSSDPENATAVCALSTPENEHNVGNGSRIINSNAARLRSIQFNEEANREPCLQRWHSVCM